MIEVCDMCGSKIKDGQCSCGVWSSKEENESNPIHLGLEKFHEMKQMTFTTDAPHLGCACVYFRGDYKDCKLVEEFIFKMKGRPYYGER